MGATGRLAHILPQEGHDGPRRYYGDNTGALVDTVYAKHAAHLLHRMSHNQQHEVREAAAIRITEAQTARKACPWHSSVSLPPWAPAFGPSCNSS